MLVEEDRDETAVVAEEGSGAADAAGPVDQFDPADGAGSGDPAVEPFGIEGTENTRDRCPQSEITGSEGEGFVQGKVGDHDDQPFPGGIVVEELLASFLIELAEPGAFVRAESGQQQDEETVFGEM